MQRAAVLAIIVAAAFGGAYALRGLSPEFEAPIVDAPGERIVSLKPSVTEFLFALGAGDRVVAAESTATPQ